MTSRGINYHRIGGGLYRLVFAYGDFNVVLFFCQNLIGFWGRFVCFVHIALLKRILISIVYIVIL